MVCTQSDITNLPKCQKYCKKFLPLFKTKKLDSHALPRTLRKIESCLYLGNVKVIQAV